MQPFVLTLLFGMFTLSTVVSQQSGARRRVERVWSVPLHGAIVALDEREPSRRQPGRTLQGHVV